MIIDGHQHIPGDYQPILDRMDALGIDRTVLVGVGVRDLSVITIRDSLIFRSHALFKTFGMIKAHRLAKSRVLLDNLLGDPVNEKVLRAIRERPDRFTGFVFVNPESPRALEEARRCLDAGMKGIKLALFQYPTDTAGPRMAALCELAQERKVPMFIHQGLDHRSADLDKIVSDFPGMTFIVAHAGVQYYEDAIALARANENVMVDISSYIVSATKLKHLCGKLSAEKLLFGSDVPVMCRDMSDALEKVGKVKMSGSARDKILGGNMAEILGV